MRGSLLDLVTNKEKPSNAATSSNKNARHNSGNMKEMLKEDDSKCTKFKSSSNQIRHNDRARAKHYENANGDFVFCCKKENGCATKMKKTATGDAACSGEHGKLFATEFGEKNLTL